MNQKIVFCPLSVTVVVLLLMCHKFTMASKHYYPPPKYEESRQSRIKLNLGLHIPPIVVKLPRMEMPQLIIGANLIKNPKAKPLTINMPPPPSISFGDSSPPAPPPEPKYPSYMAAAASNQIDQKVRSPQEIDMKAYSSDTYQMYQQAPHGMMVPPPPMPVPMASAYPPPPQYHQAASNVAPPAPYGRPSHHMMPPPPPQPVHQAVPSRPYMVPAAPYGMMVPPPPPPVAPVAPMPYHGSHMSSPSNPIQSYPVQQHYYQQQVVSGHDNPQHSTLSLGYIQADTTGETMETSVAPMPNGMMVPPPPGPMPMPQYQPPMMMPARLPFNLVKSPYNEENKFLIRPNELYDSNEVSAAYESVGSDMMSEDIARDYNAAPKISMHRYTRN